MLPVAVLMAFQESEAKASELRKKQAAKAGQQQAQNAKPTAEGAAGTARAAAVRAAALHRGAAQGLSDVLPEVLGHSVPLRLREHGAAAAAPSGWTAADIGPRSTAEVGPQQLQQLSQRLVSVPQTRLGPAK